MSRAHPDPRAKKTTAPSRNPFPTRAPPEPRPQPPDPGVPLHGHGINAETGAPPRHPATRPPTARTTRPHDPATPATAPDPRTTPRTTRPLNPAPHPGADTTQPHLDHSTHRPKNTKHSSPLNSVPYVPLRLFRGPTRPRTVAAAASSLPARSALTTKSHTTSDAACRSSRLRSPLTEEPPEEPPGVGRQNHTNAATRTTPPSTSHNERNNTPRPHGTAPLGDDSGTPPRTPANRPRTSRVATGRPSLDHLQPGQEPDGSATTGQRMDRRDRKQIRVTLQEASTAPGPAARAVQGRCGRSARPPRHPPTGAQLPRGPRGSPRPRGRRQA